MSDYHDVNRANWDERVPAHAASPDYAVARFAEDPTYLSEVVRFDHLYIGGGNAKDIHFPLPPDVTIVPNTDGLTGGIRLWRKDPTAYAAVDVPSRDGAAAEPEGEPAP